MELINYYKNNPKNFKAILKRYYSRKQVKNIINKISNNEDISIFKKNPKYKDKVCPVTHLLNLRNYFDNKNKSVIIDLL